MQHPATGRSVAGTGRAGARRLAAWAGAAALTLGLGWPAAAPQAQALPRDALVVLREIDADRYDPARTSALAAGEALFLLSDTLVTLDWDQRTVRPGLAESWTVSEDGRTYTFKIRQGVSFCDGKPFTARDAAYSLSRWADPATRSPVRWRAGPVKRIHATDDHTLVYELNEPFSELLLQLTHYFGAMVDQATVERLGDNFGVQGFNGTGPYCWQSWTPRQEMVLTRHPRYNWGPPIYNNPSPQIERVILRVIPEATTRLAAIQTGQGDVTQWIPHIALESLRRVPTLTVQQQPVHLFDHFLGFKVDKPVAGDPAIRRAVNLAVDKQAIARAVFFGAGEAATAYLNPETLDYSAEAAALVPQHDPNAARRVLDEAGWRPGPDGVRVKDGQRASLLLYALQTSVNNTVMQAIQADLRRVGIELRVQLWDATVGWGKLATQEFDAFVMSYPYMSATDAFSLYFPSANRPTPNRMNWNDPETDRDLAGARQATDPAERARLIGAVQRRVAEANVWLPLLRQPLWVASTRRVEGVRPHGLYGVALYKGLDLRLTR
ncbi:ABC transporter substrate-binding protein [Pseudoroseomonas cervicalis]|uniref:ABC transporter substrate-binding protein n=1 Tax=Teichococcus cervicalis TaxID=204525 RepID=UPI002783BDFB|nr:ABC transporter substrate-binding protein [Pseudoroseomonas cervicalis]MDQ1081762.1 ABC-type transport system substrate-binding protein [Pseudoroseomonas cervicalis]